MASLFARPQKARERASERARGAGSHLANAACWQLAAKQLVKLLARRRPAGRLVGQLDRPKQRWPLAARRSPLAARRSGSQVVAGRVGACRMAPKWTQIQRALESKRANERAGASFKGAKSCSGHKSGERKLLIEFQSRARQSAERRPSELWAFCLCRGQSASGSPTPPPESPPPGHWSGERASGRASVKEAGECL